jgi:hypothetical protein
MDGVKGKLTTKVLIGLTPEIDCDQTTMVYNGPPVTAVSFIAK